MYVCMYMCRSSSEGSSSSSSSSTHIHPTHTQNLASLVIHEVNEGESDITLSNLSAKGVNMKTIKGGGGIIGETKSHKLT